MAIQNATTESHGADIFDALFKLKEREPSAINPLADQLIKTWYERGDVRRRNRNYERTIFYDYVNDQFTLQHELGKTIFIGVMNINRMKGAALLAAEAAGDRETVASLLIAKLADTVATTRMELIAVHRDGDLSKHRIYKNYSVQTTDMFVKDGYIHIDSLNLENSHKCLIEALALKHTKPIGMMGQYLRPEKSKAFLSLKPELVQEMEEQIIAKIAEGLDHNSQTDNYYDWVYMTLAAKNFGLKELVNAHRVTSGSAKDLTMLINKYRTDGPEWSIESIENSDLSTLFVAFKESLAASGKEYSVEERHELREVAMNLIDLYFVQSKKVAIIADHMDIELVSQILATTKMPCLVLGITTEGFGSKQSLRIKSARDNIMLPHADPDRRIIWSTLAVNQLLQQLKYGISDSTPEDRVKMRTSIENYLEQVQTFEITDETLDYWISQSCSSYDWSNPVFISEHLDTPAIPKLY